MSCPPGAPAGRGVLTIDRAAAKLFEISVALSEPIELDEVLKRVRVAVIEGLGFDRCGIFVLDEPAGLLRGTWGTDQRGELEDLSGEIHRLSRTDHSVVQVALGQIPYFLTDDLEALAHAEGLPNYPRMRGVHANACLPLKARGRVVGVLALDNLLTDRPIDRTDLEAVAPFAAQAAIAVDNALLLARLEARERERRRLFEASAALASVLDLRALIALILRSAAELFGFDAAGIWLHEPAADLLRGQYALLPSGEIVDLRHDLFPMGDHTGHMSGVVAGKHAYFLTQDMHTLPEGERTGVPVEVRAQVIVPLLARGRVMGALTGCTLSPERGIPEMVIEPLGIFASQAAVAIENARLHETVDEECRRLETAFSRSQERLLEAGHLATIGQMAGSIADGLRDPLNVLQTNRHLLQRMVGGTNSRVDASLQRMAEYLDRATRLGNDFLAFARDGRLNPQSVSPGLLLREVADDLAIPSGITVAIAPTDPLLIVEADALQLHQALRHLLLNAVQAMPEGGTLTLSAARPSPRPTSEGLVYPEGVEFTVRDTGVGMAPGQVARDCDPLFTRRGEGSGLGLALVLRAVEAHEGCLRIESEPGRGTTVRVWLPAAGSELPKERQ
jgi:two-component system, NtrC family, sensor histidine kinase HydH